MESNLVLGENIGERFCDSVATITQCKACSSNQSNMKQSNKTMRKSRRNSFSIAKTIRGMPLWSTVILLWISLMVRITEGLQCYECLSLYCNSGAVCDAIKSTMVEIFVPKRHFIHFDPSDLCPEDEPSINSTRWANLSRECERSDSLCLVSPIEVHTVVDGKKNGKKLENEYTLMTYGYLRGCASRRKMLEFPETINVRVQFFGQNESNGNNKINDHSLSEPRGRSSTASGSAEEAGKNGSKNKNEIFYNMTNIPGSEFHPTKKTYKDGYAITKIYSHVFYIDQGTQNATKCYEDNCNDKVKFKRIGSSGVTLLSNSNVGYTVLTASLIKLMHAGRIFS